MSLLAPSVLLAAVVLAGPALSAQAANRITQPIDTSEAVALPNHHPLWANSANNTGLAPADLSLNQVTLVLSRSAQQEAAFQQFLADQQNPASPDYHHWLTPAEVGDRFGLSDEDINTITAWLQSQGLRVNWVAPSRIFIGFSGAAADVGRAFQTEMHTYSVSGQQRLSVSSDPMVPAALAPAIKSIHGLYTIDEHPLHQAGVMQSVSPQMNASSGNHYLAPADFATIYDLPSGLTGAGITIGIVDRSRTNFADFSNFRALTGSTFPNPTEFVPTALGGVDPGPAYTAPPGGSTSTSEQGEATLDVLRAGSVAPGANLLLVVATAASGGIGVDAQYLVQTSPAPAQVMSISYGACELSAGASSVAFWDTLFQQATAEGISVFVSSGDAGASGCDTHGSAPPANPSANSPNYICSSSYATCVGGTQFNDTTNPSLYWNSGNGSGLKSVLSYVPEGGWNESTTSNVAASGGGVSSVIATPSWQTGSGVPAARAGRYTPDISFSSSAHDGYFGCFAAGGAGCVVSGGSYSFEYFYGTSAAAPDMAGIAALLDQKLGAAQGNLNPAIYSMAAILPAAFHDVTVSTSGVSSCSVSTASLCNNSITLLSGSGAQPGYLVGTGYDEVTGLGSLDVSMFLNNYGTSSGTKTTPTITWSTPAAINYGTALSATQLNATASVPGTFVYSPAAGTVLTAGSQLLSVTFTPSDTTTYNTATATVTLTVKKVTPAVTWSTPAAITYGISLSTTQLNATASVPGSFVYSPAAGIVLATGSQPLGVTFTPTDTTDYNTATGSVTLTVNKATPIITWSTPAAVLAGTTLSATQLNATASVPGTFVYTPVLGTVMSTAGNSTLSTTFTPTDTTDYSTATASVTLAVTSFAVSGGAVTISTPGATTGNTSTVTVTPGSGFTGNVTLTAAITSSPSGAQYPPTLSFTANPVSITSASAGTATLTISTTASQTVSCTAVNQTPRGIPWYAQGGAVLACVLLFGIAPRRKGRAILGMLLLLVALAGGMFACGGASSKTNACSTAVTPGTTIGSYTITLTGTSGSTTATNTISLTVQ